MAPKQTAGLLTVALLLTAFTASGLFAQSTNAPAVGVLSFTNSPQGKAVTFWFTNYAKSEIAFMPFYFEEQQTNGVWKTNSFLTSTRKPVNVWRNKWIGMREQLAPGQGFIFSVPMPTNELPWRITFNCSERALLTDAARDLVRHATATNAAMQSSKVYSGTRHVITTPEVSGKIPAK